MVGFTSRIQTSFRNAKKAFEKLSNYVYFQMGIVLQKAFETPNDISFWKTLNRRCTFKNKKSNDI